MDTKKIFQISVEGLVELKAELEDRLSNIRKEIADEIEYARQQGDLSENAAYKAALEKKEFNEKRIADLNDMINNAQIIEKSKTGKLDVGSKVELRNVETDKVITYTLVTPTEADPVNGKISIESPIGKALQGKKQGEKVLVSLPLGDVTFVISKIE